MEGGGGKRRTRKEREEKVEVEKHALIEEGGGVGAGGTKLISNGG